MCFPFAKMTSCLRKSLSSSRTSGYSPSRLLQIRKEDKFILVQLFKVHGLAAESWCHRPAPANSSGHYVPNGLLPRKTNKTGLSSRVCTRRLCNSLHKLQLFSVPGPKSEPDDSPTSTLTTAFKPCCQKNRELQDSENSFSFRMPSPVSQRKAPKIPCPA